MYTTDQRIIQKFENETKKNCNAENRKNSSIYSAKTTAWKDKVYYGMFENFDVFAWFQFVLLL